MFVKIKLFSGVVAVTSIITACAATPQYELISTKEQYVQTVSGRTLNLGNSSTTIHDDGRMTGIAGNKEIDGQWTWEGGKFCREGRIGNEALKRDCQKMELAGDRLKITRGDGSVGIFNIK
ncbi:hypothetical protein OAM69_05370 [bacterium]|nr:hypothetical protein [bacterium]